MSLNSNKSLWPIIDGDFEQYYIVVIHVVSMLISIPGNFVITYTILKSTTLWAQHSFRFLASVSTADFFVGILSQLLLIARILRCNYILLDFTTHIVNWSLCAASGFGVLVLTIERFLYFKYPLKYNLILTEKRTALIILMQWASGTFFRIALFVYRNDRFWYTLTLSVLGCSNLAMIFVYQRVRKIIRSRQKIFKGKCNQYNRDIKPQNQKNNFFLFAIVMVFCGFWYPAVIVMLIRAFHGSNITVLNATVFWLTTLGCLNSSFNIFIYGLGNNKMKKEVLRIIKRSSTNSPREWYSLFGNESAFTLFARLTYQTNLRNSLLHCRNAHDYWKFLFHEKYFRKYNYNTKLLVTKSYILLYTDLHFGQILEVIEARKTC